MAAMMKTLMDAFDARAAQATADEDYETAFCFRTAESWANTCHGLPAQEVLLRVRQMAEPFTTGEDPVMCAVAAEVVAECERRRNTA